MARARAVRHIREWRDPDRTVPWFFIVAESHFSVHYRLNLLGRGLVDSASDTTSIGLTMFSGWILALPYCGILVLIRKLLKRFGVVQETGGEQDEDDQADSRSRQFVITPTPCDSSRRQRTQENWG